MRSRLGLPVLGFVGICTLVITVLSGCSSSTTTSMSTNNPPAPSTKHPQATAPTTTSTEWD